MSSLLVARGLLAYTASNTAIRLLRLFGLLVAARALSISDFGVLSATLSLVAIVGNVSMLGMDNTALRFSYQAVHDPRWSRPKFLATILIPSILLSSLASLLLWAGAARFLVDRGLSGALIAAAGLIAAPFAMQRVLSFFFRGVGLYRGAAAIDVMAPLAFAICVSVIAVSGRADVPAIIAAYGSSFVLPVVIGTILALRSGKQMSDERSPENASPDRTPHGVGSLIAFGTTTMLGTISSLARTEIDRLILFYYTGPVAVGGYNVAERGARQLNVFNAAFGEAIATSLVRGHEDSEKLQRASRRQADAVFWLAGPLVLAALLIAPFLMSIFGREYLAFVPVFVVLGVASFLNVALGPVEMHLRLQGFHRGEAVLLLISMALIVGLGLILVPPYGVYGATIAAVVGTTTFKATAIVMAVRQGIMSFPPTRLLRLLPACGILFAYWYGFSLSGRVVVLGALLTPVAVLERENVRNLADFIRRRLSQER